MKIVVTTDFSPESKRAFPLARSWAERFGAELTLLHVTKDPQILPGGTPLASPLPAPSEKEELQDSLKHLREIAAELGPNVACEARVASNVPHAIADFLKRHGADLLICATHGRSGLRRLVLGSVTDQILRYAHVPVVCVPPLETR